MARRNRALILLAFALASGVLAALLALRYLRQQSAPLVVAEPARSSIVVAARALPVGSVIVMVTSLKQPRERTASRAPTACGCPSLERPWPAR